MLQILSSRKENRSNQIFSGSIKEAIVPSREFIVRNGNVSRSPLFACCSCPLLLLSSLIPLRIFTVLSWRYIQDVSHPQSPTGEKSSYHVLALQKWLHFLQAIFICRDSSVLDFRPCDKLLKRYLGLEKILGSPLITPIDNGLILSTQLETKLEKRINVECELF